jgi:hypothetical protein
MGEILPQHDQNRPQNRTRKLQGMFHVKHPLQFPDGSSDFSGDLDAAVDANASTPEANGPARKENNCLRRKSWIGDRCFE